MSTLHEDTHVEEAEANEQHQEEAAATSSANPVEAVIEENSKLPHPLQPQKVTSTVEENDASTSTSAVSRTNTPTVYSAHYNRRPLTHDWFSQKIKGDNWGLLIQVFSFVCSCRKSTE